jgi:hypothetical protein
MVTRKFWSRTMPCTLATSPGISIRGGTQSMTKPGSSDDWYTWFGSAQHDNSWPIRKLECTQRATSSSNSDRSSSCNTPRPHAHTVGCHEDETHAEWGANGDPREYRRRCQLMPLWTMESMWCNYYEPPLRTRQPRLHLPVGRPVVTRRLWKERSKPINHE